MNSPGALPKIGLSIMERIGNTPLLRLARVGHDLPHAELYGKAEWTNPGGSVKDRAAAGIVQEAFRGRKMTGGKRLLDSTSGNTGIAYAMLGAACGFGVTLCVPANVSVERKRILKAYGAEMLFSDPADGSDGAIRMVRQIYMEDPDLYFYPDQYNNPANWKAHFEGTGAEIIEQTNGEITHFVAAMGTSGTFTGTTRRLRRDLPEVKCYSAQPSSGFHGLEGLKHMPTAIRPGFYDDAMADGNLWIETEDAYRMVRRLAKEEGLLVGISSGCNVYAATVLARELASRGESATIVTILCDSAEKYLSESFWDQE